MWSSNSRPSSPPLYLFSGSDLPSPPSASCRLAEAVLCSFETLDMESGDLPTNQPVSGSSLPFAEEDGLDYVLGFELWFQKDYETGSEAKDKMKTFFHELEAKLPVQDYPIETLDDVARELEQMFRQADRQLLVVQLESTKWWREYRVRKGGEPISKGVSAGTPAVPVVVANDYYRTLGRLSGEEVITILQENHRSREGRPSPPPEDLNDRWTRASRMTPPPDFEAVMPWTVSEKLALVQVCREDQVNVDCEGWSH
ncbi:hypothetical protein H696_00028 [Fonticula alba]|uniref:Uncharacterized protein n=1 Tax=Fonticula alba TaxID=691883 RepID=A0A058ZDE6_FONAL|nr:hypothetical protein H696_00028 [Fonticula alba]KCV72440.1 hypothetical protein H696_00028 [Fonticula alba]|eukprot:XP_009492141.1 hypothetical protein H696_00028 [Fonticula alba]